MSGHSKWATIHRAKEAKDAKKGAAFTKLAMAISIAVKEGGGITDPEKNFKLRLAMDKARQFNMPKENVTRAIEKAVGGGDQQLEQVMFEGFLPGGAGVLVQSLTDNKLRSAQQVREVIDKSGGRMGSTGSVSHMFALMGELKFKCQMPNDKSKDNQELEIIDLGVDEIEEDGEGGWWVYCHKDQTFELKKKLEEMGYTLEEVDLTMRPTTTIEVSNPETRAKIESILETLEDLDDVHKVWTNYA